MEINSNPKPSKNLEDEALRTANANSKSVLTLAYDKKGELVIAYTNGFVPKSFKKLIRCFGGCIEDAFLWLVHSGGHYSNGQLVCGIAYDYKMYKLVQEKGYIS